MYCTQNTFRFGLGVFEWSEKRSSAHTMGLRVWADWKLPSCFFHHFNLQVFSAQSGTNQMYSTSEDAVKICFSLSSTPSKVCPSEDQFNNQKCSFFPQTECPIFFFHLLSLPLLFLPASQVFKQIFF